MRNAAALVAIVLLTSLGQPAYAQSEPVRSGTIVGTYTVALGPASCVYVPDCAVWLASGCDERLTGLDPAVFTSIVDVRSLAGSRRQLVVNSPIRWLSSVYDVYGDRCQLLDQINVSGSGYLDIPSGARWLTIVTMFGPYRWELR